MRSEMKNGDVKWRVICEVEKQENKIILNNKKFEIAYKLSCLQTSFVIRKQKTTNKLHN